ncbi:MULTISPECIES: alpha/beta fold hydrolase [Streptomyces]|uniref:Soluble epoxide hydrolase n=1 Tax=Streptomyces chartreusis NRRL 3882 TaxID=1079985 RepID=A0A2N9BM66_STRCX|nr:alpha/beta hydrolase [Streptomyces chartreusis]MYS92302.1 alpha/beta fold hydrolase [Streptomyces sp. SID5464]SOR84441.1 Soluble epoxide hydrolase [Streptomyces chartreusis NRRL 3882]
MSFTVTDVPDLPAGFIDTFTSRTVKTTELTLHAVVSGDGPPLLLLPGWPQFWYSWRLVMPALAEHFTVIAPDLRGMGASDKPATGYDAATLADDMAALMTALGHDRFAVVGYDLGMLVGYALAASYRDRVTRLVVSEAILPGLSPSPPLLSDPATNEMLWHFAFNRLADINERMVAGREEIYFGHTFASKTAAPGAIPQHAIDVYVDSLRDPAALRASFEYYRTLDTSAEHVLRWRDEGPLTIPVLAIGGQYSTGTMPEETMRLVAPDVTGLVIPGAGHFLPEEAPEEVSRALLDFLR